MNSVEVLLKGMIAGLAISASVGPVNILCFSRALSRGPTSGFISGLGAALADTIYGAMAGFSIHAVIGFLLRDESRIRQVGGSLLIVVGVWYYFRRPRKLQDMQQDNSAQSDFTSAFLLNLTNPTTVLSFLAVLAALGLYGDRPWWQGFILVAGIFLAAVLWWMCLASIADHFRGRLTDRSMVWMNRAAGLAIGIFGLVTVALRHVW
jgi:threonine/homoserine/homoserine lactone efflux protein